MEYCQNEQSQGSQTQGCMWPAKIVNVVLILLKHFLVFQKIVMVQMVMQFRAILFHYLIFKNSKYLI